MKLKRLSTLLSAQPKRLFLVDGLGALLSAFLLGVVLVRFEGFFGIPRSSLHMLAALPCFFAAFDAICYLAGKARIGPFLKGIALANLGYCGLSIGVALYHGEAISIWGGLYVMGEVAVVAMLALLELNVAMRMKTDR